MEDYNNGFISKIEIFTTDQTLGGVDGSTNNRLIVNDANSKGLVYGGNYVANFTTYSLITKGYVDGKKYVETGSFTASVDTVIVHNLNTSDVVVNLWDSSGIQINGVITSTSSIHITVNLSSTLSGVKTVIIA